MTSSQSKNLLDRAIQSSRQSLKQFVDDQRRETTWPGIDWSSKCWVLPQEQRVRRKVGARIWFTTDSMEAMTENMVEAAIAMPSEFADFVKAIVVHKARTTSVGYSQLYRIQRASRYLLRALQESTNANGDPTFLSRSVFEKADQLILSDGELRSSARWTLCRALTYIGKMADLHGIGVRAIRFSTNNRDIPRFREGISKSAQEKSMGKLPSAEALEALGELYQSATEQSERILLDVVGLLVACGFRMGEALTIPADCEVKEGGRYGLRYWPEKGGDAIVKWIPSQAVELVQKSVDDLRARCAPAREMAYWLEQNPGKVKVDWSRYGKIVTSTDVGEILGKPHVIDAGKVRRDASGKNWLRSQKIKPVSWDGSKRYRTAELREVISKDRPEMLNFFDAVFKEEETSRNEFGKFCGYSVVSSVQIWLSGRGVKPIRNSYNSFTYERSSIEANLVARRYEGPVFTTPSGHRQMLSETLVVTFEGEMRREATPNRLICRQLAYSTIRLLLGDGKTGGSIFDRHGYKLKNGSRILVRSHQFRHWLNTLASQGGLSDVELARWMGRKNIDHNEAYKHGTVTENVNRARLMIRERKMAGPIAEIYEQIKPEERERFLDVAIGAVFTMPHGGCMHNYASRPCPRFMACLSGCGKYHRTIGNQKERQTLKRELEFLNISIESTILAYDEGESGSFNWLKKMQKRRDGIVAALSVDEELDSSKEGELLQVFPGGDDLSKINLDDLES